MKNIFAFALLCLACSSKPPSVNPDPVVAPPFLMPNNKETMDPNLDPTSTSEPMPRLLDQTAVSPVAAIAGQVLVGEQTLPSPLGAASVELFATEPKKKSLGQTMTGADGRFSFTQKLPRGNYLLEVRSRRFQGEKTVQLDRGPVTDLVIEVSEKKKN